MLPQPQPSVYIHIKIAFRAGSYNTAKSHGQNERHLPQAILRDITTNKVYLSAIKEYAYISISINSLELEVLLTPISNTMCKTEYEKSLQNTIKYAR